MTNQQQVKSLTRNDTTLSWIPFNNSLHVALPQNVQSIHMNIYSPNGLVTFWANPNEIKGNHTAWGSLEEVNHNALNNYPQSHYPNHFDRQNTVPTQCQTPLMQRPDNSNPYYSAYHQGQSTAHQIYNQYFTSNVLGNFKPSYPSNKGMFENLKMNNNQQNSFNRSAASRKRPRRSPMPVPSPASSTTSKDINRFQQSAAQVQPSLNPLDKQTGNPINLSVTPRDTSRLQTLAQLLEHHQPALPPIKEAVQKAVKEKPTTQYSPTSTSQLIDSDDTLSSDSPMKRAVTPTTERQRSSTPCEPLAAIKEFSPSPVEPSLKIDRELLVKLKRIDVDKYQCEQSADDCFIVDNPDEGISQEKEISSQEPLSPSPPKEEDKIVFDEPPASPDSPPAKKPKLDETEK